MCLNWIHEKGKIKPEHTPISKIHITDPHPNIKIQNCARLCLKPTIIRNKKH
jgi:hypothetical protein